MAKVDANMRQRKMRDEVIFYGKVVVSDPPQVRLPENFSSVGYTTYPLFCTTSKLYVPIGNMEGEVNVDTPFRTNPVVSPSI